MGAWLEFHIVRSKEHAALRRYLCDLFPPLSLNGFNCMPPPLPPARLQPSLIHRAQLSVQDPAKSYIRLHLALWLVATAALVSDRLLWNLWPRQRVFSFVGNTSVCRDGACGTDIFCPMDEVC